MENKIAYRNSRLSRTSRSDPRRPPPDNGRSSSDLLLRGVNIAQSSTRLVGSSILIVNDPLALFRRAKRSLVVLMTTTEAAADLDEYNRFHSAWRGAHRSKHENILQQQQSSSSSSSSPFQGLLFFTAAIIIVMTTAAAAATTGDDDHPLWCCHQLCSDKRSDLRSDLWWC